MAPMYIAESKCPIKIISTSPNRGIVILLIMLGIANFNIDLFTWNSFLQRYKNESLLGSCFCVEKEFATHCGTL